MEAMEYYVREQIEALRGYVAQAVKEELVPVEQAVKTAPRARWRRSLRSSQS